MTPLNCESCDPLLIDLALGELDEATSAAVRAHADGCDACSRAIARLTAGRRAARELVMVDAPDMSSVLAAARARAAEVQAQAARASEPTVAPVVVSEDAPKQEPARGSFFDEVFRWIGAWAARPQVAMGTVFVMIIGIGLWYVPQLRWREVADPDGMMVEPDATGEVAPSSALSPAEPLALDVDPRTQRVALDEDGIDDLRPTTEIATTETTEVAPVRDRSSEVTRHADAPVPEREGVGTTAAEADDAIAVLDLAPATGLGRVEDGPLPDVATGTTETAIAIAPAPTTSPPPADEGGYYGSTPAPSAPPMPSVPTAPRTATSSTTPSSSDGVAPTTPSATALLPNAIHRQARSLATTGHCGEAVPRYEALLRDHADYADAPRAMLELGECQRQLGHLDAAATWISRAERYPSVSGDARRARVRLEAQTRASEHATTPPDVSAGRTESRTTSQPPDDPAGY